MVETNSDRVALMLRVTDWGDVDNVLTWRVDGREPTLDELRLLFAVTLEDALRYQSLLDLETALQATIDGENWGAP